ncbi:MAG: hypothetical protein ACC707_19725 [Thiohalomonadales bacterium]
MYFSKNINIMPDVSVITLRQPPSHAFGKMLHVLSAGLTSKEEKKLAFTAMSVLQAINRAFRTVGITNIVRLAIDENDVYLDEYGREDDMPETMDRLLANTNINTNAQIFDDLCLIVEHRVDGLVFIIETIVSRSPGQNQFPIMLTINGLIDEFTIGSAGSAKLVKKRLASIFESNEKYDALVMAKFQMFTAFSTNLERTLKKIINVKEISTAQSQRIVRRTSKAHFAARSHEHAALVHQGYYSYDDNSFYTWLWLDFCFEHDTYIRSTEVVTDDQMLLLDVGSEGKYASQFLIDKGLNDDATIQTESSENRQEENSNLTSMAVGVAGAVITTEVMAESLNKETTESPWWSGFFGDSGNSVDSSDTSGCSSCGGGD